MLKALDVSRSPRVSSHGLINLLVKKPIGRKQDGNVTVADVLAREPRRIASSLVDLSLTYGNLGPVNVQLLAKILKTYLCFHLPEISYRRISFRERAKNIQWKAGFQTQIELAETFAEWLPPPIWTNFEGILHTTLALFGDCQLDVYDLNENSIVVYAHKSGEYTLRGAYEVSVTQGLTRLSIFWEDFNWDVGDITPLTDLVTEAPQLEQLETRLCGSWEGPLPVFEKLTEIRCWTLDDSTVISILRICPNLRIIDLKNVRSGEHMEEFFTDSVLLDLVTENPTLWPQVQELIIRPTDLTKESVRKLTTVCPQMTRLGDLECWDVTAEEIKELNDWLYHSRSQCSLVVLSFPPSRFHVRFYILLPPDLNSFLFLISS